MSKTSPRETRRLRRKKGIRKNGPFGTPSCPRITVFRSLNHTYAQIIDDVTGRTIVQASTADKDFKSDGSTGNCRAAGVVGQILATRAVDAGISSVTFDRNGFRYHGRIKTLADAARKNGLKF